MQIAVGSCAPKERNFEFWRKVAERFLKTICAHGKTIRFDWIENCAIRFYENVHEFVVKMRSILIFLCFVVQTIRADLDLLDLDVENECTKHCPVQVLFIIFFLIFSLVSQQKITYYSLIFHNAHMSHMSNYLFIIQFEKSIFFFALFFEFH